MPQDQHPDAIDETERLSRLRLYRSENIGPITFRELLRRFGTASFALDALPDLARRGGRRGALRICSRATAEAELAEIARFNARLVTLREPGYPIALNALDDSPPVLTIKGYAVLAGRPMIGIVGARNASALGLRMARELAQELGRNHFVIASGLARGIDGAAHGGALETGTLAALAGGIDIVFPPENADLHERIGGMGLLVAESPFGTPVKPQLFPRRNRVISGVSLAVIVIEAAMKSGSLITARMALDQGREVMAVPGSPFDPRCKGSNDLIRQGATLVETADDVLRAVAAMTEPSQMAKSAPGAEAPSTRGLLGGPSAIPGEDELSVLRPKLRALLSPTPTEIDELIRLSGGSPAAIAILVLELELAGLAMRLSGNMVVLTGEP